MYDVQVLVESAASVVTPSSAAAQRKGDPILEYFSRSAHPLNRSAACTNARTAYKPKEAATTAKPRAKPLNLVHVEQCGSDADDFLSRLEDAEARDTARSLASHRSECPSPPPRPASVPPVVLPATSTTGKSDSNSSRYSGKLDSNSSGDSVSSSRRLRLPDAPATAERPVGSARARHTPRPSPHPSTPRAPRAVRTPKGTGGEPAVPIIGFQGFDISMLSHRK